MNVDRPSSAHRTDVPSFKSDRKFTLFGYTCSHGPIEMSRPGNKIYSLKGTGWQGFVVGGILSVCQDELDFGAPSALTSDTRFGSSPFWER